MHASNTELRDYGYPERPDEKAQPAEFRQWQHIISRAITRVVPAFGFPPVIPGEEFTGGGFVQPVSGTSGNWAGMVCYADQQKPVNYITGGWTVPDIRAEDSGGLYLCANWLGIDGWRPDGGTDEVQLVQMGTTQLYTDLSWPESWFDPDRASYPWFEWLPEHPITITNLGVSAGDVMWAKIQVLQRNAEGFVTEVQFTLSNVTTGAFTTFAKTVPSFKTYTVPLAGVTGEWVVELPPGSGNLGQFGSVYFDGCIGFRIGGGAVYAGKGELVTMVDASNYPMAMPTVLNDTAFRVDSFFGE